MTGHKTPEEGDNWLDGRAIVCPHCQLSLWRVVRSPFYDSWFFYCDWCPKRADVSFYDREVTAIHNVFVAQGDETAFQSDRMYREIERRLAPCDCGGQFRMSADRRCHRCHAIVVAGRDADGIDLWPHWPDSDPDDDLTPEQERESQEFERAFLKTDNLWRDL